MTREDVVRNLLSTYGKYGVTRDLIEEEIESGLKDDFSYQTIYTGLRMVLGNTFGVREYFTTQELAEALGTTQEEIAKQTEKMLDQVKASGGNPDDYAVPVDRSKTQRFIVYPGGTK